MTENEEEDLQDWACPAVPHPVNPPGWAKRTSCDECREKIAYIAGRFLVPAGTPILCGPCGAKAEIRAKWEIKR